MTKTFNETMANVLTKITKEFISNVSEFKFYNDNKAALNNAIEDNYLLFKLSNLKSGKLYYMLKELQQYINNSQIMLSGINSNETKTQSKLINQNMNNAIITAKCFITEIN